MNHIDDDNRKWIDEILVKSNQGYNYYLSPLINLTKVHG